MGFLEFAPAPNDVGHAGVGRQDMAQTPEMIRLCVSADRQHCIDLWKSVEKPVMPSFTAFPPRRQISAGLVVTRKAKPHRNDGDARDIVKSVSVETEPGAQPVAGRIVEGNAGLIDEISRSLAGDQQTGSRADPQHGTRRVREPRTVWLGYADVAGADARHNLINGACACIGSRRLLAGHGSAIARATVTKTPAKQEENSSPGQAL